MNHLLWLLPLAIAIGLGGWALALRARNRGLELDKKRLQAESSSLKEVLQNAQRQNSQDLAKNREAIEAGRKQLAEADRYRQLVGQLPVGMVLADTQGGIIFINREAEEITGWSSGDAIGKNWNAVFKSQSAGSEDRIEALLNGRERAAKDQEVLVDKNGRDLTVNSRLWRYDSGQKMGWAFITSSPTVDYNKLRDEFVTNISHELRTPLTVIKGYAEILYDEAVQSGQQNADLVKVVMDECERLANILDNILNFQSASSGQIGLRSEKIDLLKLLHTVINDIKPKADKKRINVVEKFPESISPAKGDFNALRFAFSQILDNAVKFTNQGGSVTVETGGWRLEQGLWKVEINFIDTGVGISETDLPHIFEKFYRTDQKVHTIQGTGIGLSLCKEIIETNGGSISVESIVGSGSHFSVTLPMSE
jgi:PAS domain S-box-containing protein